MPHFGHLTSSWTRAENLLVAAFGANPFADHEAAAPAKQILPLLAVQKRRVLEMNDAARRPTAPRSRRASSSSPPFRRPLGVGHSQSYASAAIVGRESASPYRKRSDRLVAKALRPYASAAIVWPRKLRPTKRSDRLAAKASPYQAQRSFGRESASPCGLRMTGYHDRTRRATPCRWASAHLHAQSVAAAIERRSMDRRIRGVAGAIGLTTTKRGRRGRALEPHATPQHQRVT